MLVEIAGIDGSGKSSLVDSLTGWAHRRGGTTYDWTIRSTTRRLFGARPELARRVGRDAVELAVCAELIKEANAGATLRAPGQLVLTDNYVRHWIANAAQYGTAIVEEIASLYREFVPSPDLCIELEIDYTVAFERILNRSKLDPSVHQGGPDYLKNRSDALSNTRGICGYQTVCLPGNLPPEEILERVCQQVLACSRRLDDPLFRPFTVIV
jgi:thymidylate kinase